MLPPDLAAQVKSTIAELTNPEFTPSVVDVSNCDREPIHIPSAIQPHGILLAIREADLRIVQISQNSAEYLGYPPETLLDQPLSALLSPPQIASIQACLAGDFEYVNPLQLTIDGESSPRLLEGVVHRSGEIIILELEQYQSAENVTFFDFYQFVKQPIQKFLQTQTIQALCQAVTQEIQQITGFDRVMVYRFDDNGVGSVIAEVCREDLSPYLGLHYPASDIPQQAKYLYSLNPLRLIPDVAYEPVPLRTISDGAGQPLDMTLSTLRSVSPIHIEYLHNMGVKASMSISLLRHRSDLSVHPLWGLIACHHNSPRKLSYAARTICEFLGQVISLELAAREAQEKTSHRIRLQDLQNQFMNTLSNSPTLAAGLHQESQHLLDLVGAQGLAVCEQKNITLIGKTPSRSKVLDLVQWLQDQFTDTGVYHTDHLTQVYPAAAQMQKTASGIIAVTISQAQQFYILWFRPEVIQTVHWAGDPTKPITIHETGEIYLSPRQSFERWKETVRGRSLPWQPYDLEAAIELRSTIVSGLVVQKAHELTLLNQELERRNFELDSFAYVASHDLKEPLRGIHNYSSFLLEDYGTLLDADGTEKLQTLMRLTQRMENLISSLLHYSRLGRVELSLTMVDLNDLVEGVVEILNMSQSDPIEIRVPRSLPHIQGDRNQLIELLINLISNGVKYNDKPDPWIEVGYLTPEEVTASNLTINPAVAKQLVMYVRDNGIGIRPQHIESIFRIFKRLHPPGRFGGGTGAGLTIAKKIVERHGGEIWVESTYGVGSTFYFTLGVTFNV
ncbi:ATP-binding protein [Alkalinema sp. FACHB-956]|uniref:ATP-binding protein n=1 Tax=Alkalinema sp. FACHB-956 TaxID=2692768 RepID=UPI001686476D|nr:ATP-binding protein [Alkalinema sp. FACHB-956]MBD2328071.1 GAF domain-containing protein [Alkalinema sp. FACHB-956]